MKIVFLNTWNGKLATKIERYIKLHTKDTDIFCFQEVDKEMRKVCDRTLKDYKCIFYCKNISENDFWQATYVRNDIYVESESPVLDKTPEVGLGIYTKLSIDGKSLHVCNVHGVSRPGDKLDTPERLKQSEELISFFKNLSGPKIIGGDFNLDINSKSIKMFEQQGYEELVKKYKISTTRNKFIWERHPDHKQYYSDYVLVSKDVKVKNFTVSGDEVSDHQPMILTIIL